MEHLLQRSKRYIFHNIFKYVIFQKGQKVLLNSLFYVFHIDFRR